MTDTPANPLRDKLRAGVPAFGTFVFSPDPAHSEIVAAAGLDFAVIDTEHAALDAGDVTAHARSLRARGCTAIARVRNSEPADVGRILDTGAQGVMFPHVGLDMERTVAALDAMRYAPAGTRPTCTGTRAATYGLGDFAEYQEASNRDAISIGLIEDVVAVENIDDVIADLPLDVVMAGAGDLATSLGVPGQQTHPSVLEAVRTTVDAAKASGKVKVGAYVLSAQSAQQWLELGVDLLVMNIDYRMLADAYRGLLAEVKALV